MSDREGGPVAVSAATEPKSEDKQNGTKRSANRDAVSATHWGLPPEPANIPPELKAQRRWVAWVAVPKPDGKISKVPRRPRRPDQGASTKDPTHWGTFDEAWRAYTEHGLNGIGFVLTSVEGVDDAPVFAVDLDHCVDAVTGEIEPNAKTIVDELGTYCELSPSGTGIRAFALGQPPGNIVNHAAHVEVYGGVTARFVTVTGHGSGEVVAPPDDVLRAIQDRYGKKGTAAKSAAASSELPDAERCAELEADAAAALGEETRPFWTSGEIAPKYQSPSEQVQACYTALLYADWRPADVFAAARTNEHVFGTYLRKRQGDGRRAEDRLWKDICAAEGFAEASTRVASADGFEDLTKGESNVARSDPFAGTEPLNLFTESVPQPFDPEDYPPVVRRWAPDVARRIGTDPLVTAWSMLVCAAALIPDCHVIQPKANDGGWLESARLWVAFIAPPAAGKSPAIREAMRPLHALQAKFYDDYRQRLAAWEIAEAEAKAEKRPPPSKPTVRRILVDDATIEALATILAENDQGILCYRDELSGWFGAMDGYRVAGRSMDRPAWLGAFEGGHRYIDRAKRDAAHVKNFSASVLGGIQPEPMRAIAGQLQDDGLLQRFITLPVQPMGEGADVPADEGAERAWRRVVDALSKMEVSLEESRIVYRCDAAAQAVMTETTARLVALVRSPAIDGRAKSALVKARAQFARLVLVFHVLEHVQGDGLDDYAGLPSRVDVGVVRRAQRVMLGLVVPACLRFYADIVGLTPQLERARWAADFILAHPAERIAARDLYRSYREFRAGQSVDHRAIGEAMEQLELAGWVVPVPPKPGQPPKAWQINPRVYIQFAVRAEAERHRRAAVVAHIRSDAALSHLSLARTSGDK